MVSILQTSGFMVWLRHGFERVELLDSGLLFTVTSIITLFQLSKGYFNHSPLSTGLDPLNLSMKGAAISFILLCLFPFYRILDICTALNLVFFLRNLLFTIIKPKKDIKKIY